MKPDMKIIAIFKRALFLYLFFIPVFCVSIINKPDGVYVSKVEVLRRLRFDSGDIFLGGVNLTSAWVETIENNPENVPALSVDNGVVTWRGTVEEKTIGILQAQLNLARRTRPRTVNSAIVSNVPANQPDLFCRLASGSSWNTLGEFCGWKILLNPYSLDQGGHFTIIPVQVTMAEHRAQKLTSVDIGFALTLLNESTNLRIFYNDWGAGASQDHFHFQGIARAFPVEAVELTDPIYKEEGIEVFRLDNFPSRGIVVCGSDKAVLEKTVFSLVDAFYSRREISASDEASGKNEKFSVNLLFTKEAGSGRYRVYIFPRARETSISFPGKNMGLTEIAGLFIFEDESQYRDADLERKIVSSMDMATLSWAEIDEVVGSVLITE